MLQLSKRDKILYGIIITTLVSSIGYIFFQISNQLFYSILTLKLDFSRACLSGLHILLGQLLPI